MAKPGYNPILPRWYKLYTQPSDPEILFEPVVAKLGIPYRFQHIFCCKYVMDFAFPTIKVDLEVDGESHRRKSQILHDEERRVFMAKRGWQVIRVTNEEVNIDPYGTINRVMSKLNLPNRAERS